MKPKAIIFFLFVSFVLLLTVLILGGCVPTYRIIHSGTITIIQPPREIINLDEPLEVDYPELTMDQWLDRYVLNEGEIVIDSGGSLVIQRQPDDVADIIIGDPYPEITGGDGITVDYDEISGTITITSVDTTESPSEYSIGHRHINTTTFLVNGVKTCKCFDCGQVIDCKN